jgi:hypothetical protein
MDNYVVVVVGDGDFDLSAWNQNVQLSDFTDRKIKGIFDIIDCTDRSVEWVRREGYLRGADAAVILYKETLSEHQKMNEYTKWTDAIRTINRNAKIFYASDKP